MKVEDIVVYIVLLAILFGVNNFYKDLRRRGAHNRDSLAKMHMKTFGQAVKMYKAQKGFYPNTLEDLIVPDEAGDMVLEIIPEDPWGNAYIYERRGRRFEIICLGADGMEGGEQEDADIVYSALHRGH